MNRAPRRCQAEGCSTEHPPYGFPMPDGKGDIVFVQVCGRCRAATEAASDAAMAPLRAARGKPAVKPGERIESERRVLPPPLPDTGGQGRLL